MRAAANQPLEVTPMDFEAQFSQWLDESLAAVDPKSVKAFGFLLWQVRRGSSRHGPVRRGRSAGRLGLRRSLGTARAIAADSRVLQRQIVETLPQEDHDAGSSRTRLSVELDWSSQVARRSRHRFHRRRHDHPLAARRPRITHFSVERVDSFGPKFRLGPQFREAQLRLDDASRE
jgi:hypothetical protein